MEWIHSLWCASWCWLGFPSMVVTSWCTYTGNNGKRIHQACGTFMERQRIQWQQQHPYVTVQQQCGFIRRGRQAASSGCTPTGSSRGGWRVRGVALFVWIIVCRFRRTTTTRQCVGSEYVAAIAAAAVAAVGAISLLYWFLLAVVTAAWLVNKPLGSDAQLF